MKQKLSATGDIREKSRKIYSKSALAKFSSSTSAIVRITDISFVDVYVISPVHTKRGASCWLHIPLPLSTEQNQTFKIETQVISSIYSRKKNGFIVGLDFVKTEKSMLRLITRL